MRRRKGFTSNRVSGLRVAALRMAERNEGLPPPPGEEGVVTNTAADCTFNNY